MGHGPSAQPTESSQSPFFQEVAQALYKAANQAMFVVDERGRILDANDAACRLMGSVMTTLHGISVADLLPEDGFMRDLNGRSHPITLAEKGLENGRKLLIATPAPEPQPTYSPMDQKTAVLANSPYGFDVVSADGKFVYANQAYLQMWGYDSLEEIVSTSPAGHCADPTVPVEIIQNLEANGQYTMEFTALRQDGTTFQVLMSAQKVVDSQGVVTYEGTSIDVTERYQAREALRQSEANLRAIFNNSLQGFVLLDRERHVLAMNPVAMAVVEKQTMRPFHQDARVEDLFSPGQLNEFDRLFAQALAGQSTSHQLRVQTAERQFWYEVHLNPVATDDGQVTGVSLSFLDITGRKTAETALEASEVKLSGIIDSAMDAIVSLDEDQHIVLFNTAAQRMFGYTAEEAIGQLHNILLPERLHQDHHSHVIRFGETGKADLNMGEHRALVGRRASGEEFPIEVSVSRVKVGEKTLFTAIMRDITERVQAEAALLASEERLHLFIDHAPAALAMFDREMCYLAVSQRWVTDYTLGDVMGRSHYDVFPEIPERWKVAHQRALAGEVITADEDRFVRQDGRVQWLRWEVRPWYTADNRVGGIVVFSEEVTERKEAEEAVKDLQAMLSEAESVARMGSWRWDLATQKVAWSNQMFNLFGVDPATFDGDLTRIVNACVHPDDLEAVNQSNVAVMEQHAPVPLEYRIVLPDGAIRTVWAEGRLLHNEAGQPTALVGYVQDITERKRIQAAMEELQELLAEAESVARMGSFKWDLATKRFTWSDGLYQLFQVDRATFDGDVNRAVRARIHPDDWEKANQAAITTFVQNEPVSVEYRLVLPDGSQPVVWQDSRLIFDENGRPTAIIGYVQDITERKVVEQALRDSEERYHNTLENMLEGCQIISFDWRYLYLNASVVASGRRRKEEMLGRTMMEVFPGIENTELFTVLRRCMARRTSQLLENQFVYEDGSHAWFNLSIQPVPEGLFILSIDITQRKQVEEALRQSEERFSKAFQLSPAALSMTRQDGRLVDVNQSYERLSGYTRAELIGRDATDFGIFTPAQRDDLRRRMAEAGGTLHEAEMVVRNKAGELRHVLYSVEVVEIDDEQFALTLAIDITERKQLEMALKEMADNMATAQAITHSGSWEIRLTPDGSLIDPHVWSDECYRIFGLEPGACPITVAGYYAMVHPDDVAEVRRVFQEGIDEQKETSLEYRLIRPDGSVRTVLDQVKPLVDERTGHLTKVVGLVQDITEQKMAAEQQMMLEAQLRQAQKMESIGRLAGGMAHDFNNQLAVIKLYGDLMRYRMPKDDPLLPKLEQIRQAVDRATHLTRQLLAFSRKQVLQPVVLDINELISNLEKMLSRLIGEDITLSTDLQPGLWSVMADPGQLEQVIMNLVINARDAMPTGGMITIETQNLVLNESLLVTHPDALNGPAVMIAITDTGIGMDEATRLQIFEPFFTTKEPGQGTGLGLATVHGIVKQSGGTIYVYSEPEQGTTFKIYLPASEGMAAELKDTAAVSALQSGYETILLVEDEQALRELVRLTLEEIGYTVLEAQDGRTALTLAAEYPETINLLLTDVVLPKKSGREVAEELQRQRPGLKVLFMSGYMDDAVMRHGVLMAEMDFLSKPFSRSTLASKVREVLEKSAA